MRAVLTEETPLARAVLWTDPRGRLNVVGRGEAVGLDGTKVRLKRRYIVAGNDQELGEAIARQLNVAFALGDISWLLESGGAKRTVQSMPKRVALGQTLGEWAAHWITTYRPPVVSRRTFENYGYAVEDLRRRIGDLPLAQIGAGDVISLRAALQADDLSPRTVGDRLGVLRMILRDARIAGHISESPFDGAMPKRRTKAERVRLLQKVHFAPFKADEIQALVAVLRDPRDARETLYFPSIEFLLLTGLRWGEGVGVIWPDVSWVGGMVRVWRAVVRGQDDIDEATKTGAKWTTPLRPPLRALLLAQKERTFVGNSEGRIFVGPTGGPIEYKQWLKLGWEVALRRAKVSPRAGDAQKALRRSYVTSSLVCGRNPKEVASELGHVTSRMVVDVYDSFLDPQVWPDAKQRAALASVYGWDESSRDRGAHVGP